MLLKLCIFLEVFYEFMTTIIVLINCMIVEFGCHEDLQIYCIQQAFLNHK